MTKRDKLRVVKQIGTVLLAALCTAFALEILLIPSDVIIGGAIGIATILDIAFSGKSVFFSAGVWMLLINLPLMIYCFFRFRRKFAIRTMLYVIFSAALVLLFRVFDLSDLVLKIVNVNDGVADKVVYTLVGGALQGLALPLMFSVNASTGGSDVIGLAVSDNGRKSGSESMRIILAANVAIVLLSSLAAYFLFKDVTRAFNMFIYSVSALFVCEFVQESAFRGYSAAIELEITTDKPTEIADALRNELKHGTSSIRVRGGYSNTEKTMVVCVINRRQLTAARKIVRSVDPSAFAYVENVREVIGKGFSNKEIEVSDDKNN